MRRSINSGGYLQYEKIKNDDSGEYIRVVSIDSPFREQIAWAYLNTAGRPGVPDRDFAIWEKQYLDKLEGNK